jgi:hypothetical protein
VFIPGCYCCDAATPVARVGHTCSTINSCMYAIGGTTDAEQWTAKNSKYEPTGDTWTVDTAMPTARRGMTSCPVSNKIYVFAGEEDLVGSDLIAKTTEFDGSVWTEKTVVPTPLRSTPRAASLGYRAYLIGGQNGVGTQLQDTDEYVPSSDSWSSKTNVPTSGRSSMAIFTLGPAIYIAAGNSSSARIDEYIPDTWTNRTNVPAPLRRDGPVGNSIVGSGTGTVSNAGYVSCGRDVANVPLQDHEEYIVDTWTARTDCPTPGRFNLSGSSVLGTAYICGGVMTGLVRIADTDGYIPDSWSSKSDMV